MDDASHVLVYRRFFGVLLTVLPGLVLCYILAGLIMLLIGDALDAGFGWAIGLGAAMFAIVLVGWIFIGSMIEKWTEEKSGMFLFGVSAPFLLILFGGFCGWYIYIESLRSDRHERERREARERAEGISYVIEIPADPYV